MPEARVLAIQHVAVEPPARIAEALAGRGVEVRVVRVDRGEPLPFDALSGASGLVVMGGPMGVYEQDRHPHLRDEARAIEVALRDELPLLGICLGSQLLASVLGARVAPGAQKEIGWLPVELEPAAADDPLLRGVPERFTAFHWHGDVFDLPRGAVALARSALTPRQAFRHGTAYGLLFHAEVTPAQVSAMADAFPEDLAAAGLGPDAVEAGAHAHSERLADIGRAIFGRWADTVAAVSRARGSRP